MHCHNMSWGKIKKRESYAVKVGDKNINELTDMSIDKIKDFLNSITIK